MKKLVLAIVLLGLTGSVIQAQQLTQAEQAYLDSYLEALRADVRSQKIALINRAIPFTEQESASFWPLYRKYDQELNQLNDERLTLIRDFAASFQIMTDAKARELVDRYLDWEEKRTKLKRQYFQEFTKILPPLKAARFAQLENKVNLLIDLQIASQVPLIE